MSFYRQLDFLVTILVTLVVFFGCIFYGALPFGVSLAIAAGVFVFGLLFGRSIAKILELF